MSTQPDTSVAPTTPPRGHRWASAEESERYSRILTVVPLTGDSHGRPYGQDEADLAIPILNFWGTPTADVGDGYCPFCEREEPSHYDRCPLWRR